MIKKFTLLFLLSVLTLAFSQTDSLNMRLLGVWEVPDTNRVIRSYDVSEGNLYVSTEVDSPPWWRFKLYIIDTGNLSVISEINDTVGTFWMAVYGDYLYGSYGHDGGLAIYDISNPDRPEREYSGYIALTVSTIRPYEDARGVYLAVTCVVEEESRLGVRIIDVTDPAHPELLDWYYVPEEITDWYYVVYHRLREMDVVYPHLFVFETIEYADTSFYWGGYEDGYVQVKMFDLRDLSAPPVVWRSERIAPAWYTGINFRGGVVNEENIFLSFEGNAEFWYFLGYTDSTIEEECDIVDSLCYPKFAMRDTFYAITYGAWVTAMRWDEGCDVDTLGYYDFEECGRSVKVSGNRIYMDTQSKIYILSWNEGVVASEERLNRGSYRIYPSPVIAGSRVEISRELDRWAGIYDISGKLRSVLRPGTREIDTRKLSPGVYFLISDDKKIKLKFVVI